MTMSESAAPASAERVRWAQVVAFVALAFALAWAVDLPLRLDGRGLRAPLATVLMAVSMYTPMVAAAIVTAVTLRSPRRVLTRLGWWPIRPVRRTLLLALAGALGSILLPIATVFLAALLGLVRLDLVGFSGFSSALAAQLPPGTRLPIPIPVLVALQLVQLPLGAVLNAFFTVGEETGWRGFLLPALRPLGTWPALLLTGAVWGLWHAPVILLGYDFGRPDASGLALMVVGCTAYGVLVGWLRIRSATVWPSVFAHAGFNAAAGFSVLVIAAGSPADPAAVGPLGWIAWILMAAVAVVLVAVRAFPARDAWAAPAAPVARGNQGRTADTTRIP
ncbi:MAG: lysostaphin resistance A-like protein [Amnibacterium sp.]